MKCITNQINTKRENTTEFQKQLFQKEEEKLKNIKQEEN